MLPPYSIPLCSRDWRKLMQTLTKHTNEVSKIMLPDAPSFMFKNTITCRQNELACSLLDDDEARKT